MFQRHCQPPRFFGLVSAFACVAAELFAMSSVWAQVSSGAQVLIEENPRQSTSQQASENALPISGRVVDADGSPVSNGQIVVVASEYARSARPIGVYIENALPQSYEAIGPVQTDEQGRFEMTIPGSRSGLYSAVAVYASAKGHGCVVQALGQSPNSEPLELKLCREHVIRGRCIDLKGQPVTGTLIRIVQRGWRPPSGKLEFWNPVGTDDKGRFLIRGIGPDSVLLQIDGGETAPHQQSVKPSLATDDSTETISLSPLKRLVGKVVFADTHEPAANARVVIPAAIVGDGRWVETLTDACGMFSICPYALDEKYHFNRDSSYIVNVFPPQGEKYRVSPVKVPVSRATTQQVEVSLQRGRLVRGKVIEAITRNPVGGARIQFNPVAPHYADSIEPSRLDTTVSATDGSYELPIPEESGHLLVLGPTLDYIRVESSVQEMQFPGNSGKERLYADAVVPVDFKSLEQQSLEITLRKGVTLRGRVVDHDDQPITKCVVISRPHLISGYKYSYGQGNFYECHNGDFEIRGCDPDKTHEVYLYDDAHRQGAVAKLTKQHEREPAVIRLEPCGSVEARLVNVDHQPIPDLRVQFDLVLADGAPRRAYQGERKDYALEADLVHYKIFESDGWPKAFQSDKSGRIQFSTLIPGAKYMVHWWPNNDTFQAPWPHVDFSVEAGEKKDLADIVIDRQKD